MHWRSPVVLVLILLAGVLTVWTASPGVPREGQLPHRLGVQPQQPTTLSAQVGPPRPVPAQAPAHLPGGAGCTCLAQDRPLRLEQPPLAGPDVQEVQEILKELGYLTELTGRYDEATEEAVRRFQRDHGLDVDGIVGPATWLVLLGAVPGRVVIPELLELPPLEELPDRFVVIDTGLRTLTLYENGRLRRRYHVAIGKPGSPTPLGSWQVVHKAKHWGGAFGSRWLGLDIPWGRYGIHGTNQPDLIGGEVSAGCIRMQNWAVEELYDLVPEGTCVYIVGPVPVRDSIYPGEAGTDVLEIQRSLAALGLYRGNLDGWFGPATAAGLRLFQERLGIDEGGRAGPHTLEALGLR
ncbi:MAG: peptidoglycan-binding protein [Firmicutes bacterium]|nr:peptidoglycan-binding protein [Bacillota bacterium]